MAFHVSGSFSGIAHASELPLPFPAPRPIGYYDGSAVTGTFSLDVVNPTFQVGGTGYAYYVNGPGSSYSVTYDIKDQHFAYTADASVILLDNPAGGAGGQSATFLTDFIPKYQGAIFSFTGMSGSLFTGLDPSSLHLDSSALPEFGTAFANAAEKIWVGVEVSAVHFDAAAVPEPTTVAMLLAGCLLMACFARRRASP